MRLQFANHHSTSIGAGPPNTIVSSIEVRGAPGKITDVNVTVDVDHSFTADLEVTLIGPEGTRVLLVGGEGWAGENFHATQFDDEAAKLITDAIAPFTGTFRPEGSLDAFDQLDPNGTWTLEIKDNAFEDGGELKRWFLDIEVAETNANALVFHSQNPVVVDSQQPNTVVSAIHVTGHHERRVQSASVTVDIEHTFVQDLTLTLISPDNETFVLADRVGGGQDNYESTVFADDAKKSIRKGEAPFRGVFKPEKPLAGLAGKPVTGAWRLEVQDREPGDGGTLKSWSLHLATLPDRVIPETQFRIDVEFLGGLSATQRAVFEDASARWSEIIVGDLPVVTVDGTDIDDILIRAQGQEIDGAGGPEGNILGQARPTVLRDGSLLPVAGIMTFDTHDLDSMESDGSLLDVIVHEMGHVLGIGTLWTLHGLLEGATGNDPVFNGQRAMEEYAKLRASDEQVPVPVANQGGPGTRNGHWRESVFDTELMTGIIDTGLVNPISLVTGASLADLGYEVNLESADPYELPAPAIRRERRAPRFSCCTLHERVEPRVLTANVASQEATMGEKLSWSIKVGSASGVTVGDTGFADVEAVMSAPAKLPADMANAMELDLQLDDVDKLNVLLVSSSVYDAKVEVKGDAAIVKLTGPLLLFGDSIKQFATSLDKLTVQNKSDKEADLQILIGRKLTS